jgi:hypothetical protein
MWGLFIGIAIGAAQVFALNKIGGMIMGDGKTGFKLLGAALLLIKMAAIVLVLYLLSTVSLAHLIWAAGGILIGLITASIILVLRRKKSDREENHVD